jgi:hypothetical protein
MILGLFALVMLKKKKNNRNLLRPSFRPFRRPSACVVRGLSVAFVRPSAFDAFGVWEQRHKA